ncbi:MAG: NAD-dependent epimerase/dehydratase family protein [Victivallales bacterium]|nr:NAD-dependent epimerase/dehydratase family protein [Victivallales bacterium]
MRDTVIVFEGANLLGCVLIEKLLQQGFKVIAIDSLPHAEQEFFARFKDAPSFSCAMSTPDVAEGEVRAVYYFGLQLCHARNKVFFLQMLDLNNSLARKAITLAEKTKAVYVGLSLRDTSRIPGIATCRYMLFPEAWQKANVYAEALARQSRESNGTDVRLIRIFNCYGKDMQKYCTSTITQFIKNALSNNPLRVFDDGKDTHAFTFADDVAELLLQLPDSDAKQLLNVMGEETISLADLARKIITICKGGELVSLASDSHEEMEDLAPDLSYSRPIVSRFLTTSLDDGLAKTIANFQHSNIHCPLE